MEMDDYIYVAISDAVEQKESKQAEQDREVREREQAREEKRNMIFGIIISCSSIVFSTISLILSILFY